MSEKVRLYKKAKREIRREVQKRRADVMNAIAREILLTPFWQRVKIAWRIVKGATL
jgi:hypothetical protein